jgi:hypothetical protein
MRSGRLVDTASLHVAVLAGIQAVWEDGVALKQVTVDTVRASASNDVDAEVLGVEAYSDRHTTATGAATSLGLAGALGVANATFQGGYCTTTKSKIGNKLTSCFQKYRLKARTKTRDFYYYNRYATAEGRAYRLASDYSPTRIDVRSHPWSGYGRQVAALVNYWPKAGVKDCKDHSVTVGYASFSAEMPIQDCKEVNPSPDATAKSMRVLYDQGAVFGGRVHGTDMSLVYSTPRGKNPPYADYTAAKYCRKTYNNCDGVSRKDPGW